jgi:type IV pilus assembly protein PilO
MAMKNVNANQLLEQLEKLPAVARHAVRVGVALLVIVLYWFTMAGSANQRVNLLQSQLSDLQNEISEARAVASNLKGFEERREELQAQLDAALSQLPNSRQMPGLLTDMSSLGKKSGLEVRTFDPTGEVSRGFFAEVPIKVEFFGAYHDVGIFFDRLSRLSRIVNITQMDMSVESERGDMPRLKVTGVATTFRFIDQKKPGKGSGE